MIDVIRQDIVDFVIKHADKMSDVSGVTEFVAEHGRWSKDIGNAKKRMERLAKAKEKYEPLEKRVDACRKTLKGAETEFTKLYRPLGRTAFQAFIGGSLEERAVFSERLAVFKRVQKLQQNCDELTSDVNTGFTQKAKAKATQLAFKGKIKIDEMKVGRLEAEIGRQLIEAESEETVRCDMTSELLAQIANHRESLTDCKIASQYAESALTKLADKLSEAVPLQTIENSKTFGTEIKSCKKTIRESKSSLAKSTRLLTDVLAESDLSSLPDSLVQRLREVKSSKDDMTERMRQARKGISRYSSKTAVSVKRWWRGLSQRGKAITTVLVVIFLMTAWFALPKPWHKADETVNGQFAESSPAKVAQAEMTNIAPSKKQSRNKGVMEKSHNGLTLKEAQYKWIALGTVTDVLPFTWRDVLAELSKWPVVEMGEDFGREFALRHARFKVVRQYFGVEVFFPATNDGLASGSAFLTSKLFTPTEQKEIQRMLEHRSLEETPRHRDLKRFRVAVSKAKMPFCWIRVVFSPRTWATGKDIVSIGRAWKDDELHRHSRYGALNKHVWSLVTGPRDKVALEIRIMNNLADSSGMASTKVRDLWNNALQEGRKLGLVPAQSLQSITGALSFRISLTQNEFLIWNKEMIGITEGLIANEKRRKTERKATSSKLIGQSGNAITRLKTVTNSVGMKLVKIAPGQFYMGSPDSDEDAEKFEKPRHVERINHEFFIGVHEITQLTYLQVMRKKHPSRFSYPFFPVESISLDDINLFCQRLSELPAEKAAQRIYRLPTEIEWEYCCRAGTTTRFGFGDDVSKLEQYACCHRNVNVKYTLLVGGKKANNWGLYDMHGNVAEWCSTRFVGDDYSKKNDDGKRYVLRGGSWFDKKPSKLRSASRVINYTAGTATGGLPHWGFRVVMVQK